MVILINNLMRCDVIERCRSMTASEDTVAELDGGANHKKPPRKARKKLLNAQDSILHNFPNNPRRLA